MVPVTNPNKEDMMPMYPKYNAPDTKSAKSNLVEKNKMAYTNT